MELVKSVAGNARCISTIRIGTMPMIRLRIEECYVLAVIVSNPIGVNMMLGCEGNRCRL